MVHIDWQASSANKTSKKDPGLYNGVLPAQMTVAIIARDFRYEIWYIFIKSSTPVADYIFFFLLLSIVKKNYAEKNQFLGRYFSSFLVSENYYVFYTFWLWHSKNCNRNHHVSQTFNPVLSSASCFFIGGLPLPSLDPILNKISKIGIIIGMQLCCIQKNLINSWSSIPGIKMYLGSCFVYGKGY